MQSKMDKYYRYYDDMKAGASSPSPSFSPPLLLLVNGGASKSQANCQVPVETDGEHGQGRSTAQATSWELPAGTSCGLGFTSTNTDDDTRDETRLVNAKLLPQQPAGR